MVANAGDIVHPTNRSAVPVSVQNGTSYWLKLDGAVGS